MSAPLSHKALALDFGITDLNVAAGEQGAGYNTTKTDAQFIGSILKVVLGLLGIVFLALTIYAGILWMTAAGNEDQVKKAKSIIVAAVIGLAITLSGYAISEFVVTSLAKSTDLTKDGTTPK
jgi:uncharacterized membrane protein